MSSPRRVADATGNIIVKDDDEKRDDKVVRRHSTTTPPKAPRFPSPKRISNATKPSSPYYSPVKFEFAGAIQPQDFLEMAACPCCKMNIDEKQQQTLAGTSPSSRLYLPAQFDYTRSTGTSVFDNDNDSVASDDEDGDEDALPKGVAEGLKYQPRKTLVQGWLHKKGTGKDWIGSRSWKPRWACLVMARCEGYEVDVPLLMIYWYPGTSAPSNVMILESTVAFPTDLEDKERWDAFPFVIRNARTVASHPSAAPIDRTFTAPKKGRDAWVYAISQALLMYEKANDKARKAILANERRYVTSPQKSMVGNRPKSSLYDEIRFGEMFVSARSNDSPQNKRMSSPPRSASPPTSPNSSRAITRPPASASKRAIPRPGSPHPVPKSQIVDM